MGEPAASTSYEVRAALEELLERDLLGPRDGAQEELPPGVPPAERYLVGRLVPRTRPSDPPSNAKAQDSDDPDLVDREVTGASEVQGDDIETGKVTRTGTMAASALGLWFRVPLDVQRIAVTAEWGRYAPAKSEVQVTEQGKARTVWKRSAGGGSVELDLLASDGLPVVVDHQQERVVLRAAVRERAGVRVVDLALVNDQGSSDGNPDLRRIYQTSITVTALDGTEAIFVGHNDPELSEPPVTHDPERLHLALLYRKHRRVRARPAVRRRRRGPRRRSTRLAAAHHLLPRCRRTTHRGGVHELDARADPGHGAAGVPELARDDLVRALHRSPRGTGGHPGADEHARRGAGGAAAQV